MSASLLTTATLTLGNATVRTPAVNTQSFALLSFFVNSTGTGVGTWSVECSNDGITFTAYTLPTTPPAAAGAAQTFGVVIDLFEFAYARLVFTGSSGSGSATVTTLVKVA